VSVQTLPSLAIALQRQDNRWVRLWPAIFECSDESWHVWKIGFLRQESRDSRQGLRPSSSFR